MRSFLVVTHEEVIEILLELLERSVDFLPKRDFVELVQTRLVEAFADAVRLRMLRLRPGVFDVVEPEEKLVVV